MNQTAPTATFEAPERKPTTRGPTKPPRAAIAAGTTYYEEVPPNDRPPAEWFNAARDHILKVLGAEPRELQLTGTIYVRRPWAKALSPYLPSSLLPEVQMAIAEIGTPFVEVVHLTAAIDNRLRNPQTRQKALKQPRSAIPNSHEIYLARDLSVPPARMYVWIKEAVPFDEARALNLRLAGLSIEAVADDLNAGVELLKRWEQGPNVKSDIAAAARFIPRQVYVCAAGQAPAGLARPLRRGAI